MTVYHVYEVFEEEPWYPNDVSSRIYKSFDDACKYGNKLIKEALEQGAVFCPDYDDNKEFNKDCFAIFLTNGCNDWSDHRIYIDGYEVR